MNTKKKDKVIALGISIISLLLFIAIGYAYFSSTVSNVNKEKISAETATPTLTFSDNDAGVSGRLNLGASINFVDLINPYTPQSLTYILEQSTSENGDTYE